MKKLLTLAAALLCTGLTTAQTMMEINDGRRYHAMSENGKYMLTYETGYIGIYNTETNEYRDYDNPAVGYNLGMGNMVTDDGYLVANIDGAPAILDIENDSWTLLGMKDEDAGKYSSANGITPSRKYIVGYVGTGGSLGQLNIKPVIWTQQEDGSYGVYEDLPYPEKDFTGAAPKYILPNWISADGTVIAAQLLMQENNCLPMVYRKAQDGTWTYEVYDKEQREEGLVFPEYPDHEPVAPDYHDYMDAAQLAAYAQDSTEYEDSCWAYQIGESTEWPTYWPDPRNYLTEDAKAQYDADFNDYVAEADEMYRKLSAYREVLYSMENYDFYAQNAVSMSLNGKYYVSTRNRSIYSTVGDAALLTIGSEQMELLDYGDGLYGQSCTNDGDVFVTDFGTAYVYPDGSTERVTLQEWLRSKGETKAADWLENVVTGTAICSSDGRVISGFYGASGAYQSWIIKLDGIPTGIDEIESGADPTARVKVYDLQGRLVKECPSAEATSGLAKGVYIIGGRKVAVK